MKIHIWFNRADCPTCDGPEAHECPETCKEALKASVEAAGGHSGQITNNGYENIVELDDSLPMLTLIEQAQLVLQQLRTRGYGNASVVIGGPD
jgi:hypothetical protein